MSYLLVIAFGYLLGCSNMAFYLAKLNRVDLRGGGSGNLGASNTVILIGWKAGVLVALHDIGKAALAALLAELFFPTLPLAGAIAGVCSVFGHMFPFYLKFRGGKGFASYFGIALALNWKFALILALVLIAITVITDYIVFATMTTVLTVPVYAAMTRGWLFAIVLATASAVIVYKHRENFVRLKNGTEIGLRRAGKHRQKAEK